MDISGILEAIDRKFNENKPDEVEGILMGGISIALEEQDGMSLLQLLNELIGYYREVSKYEEAFKVAEEIKAVAGQILPIVSIPYATSMLNIANAYRAGGRLEESIEIYNQVEEIYSQLIDPGNGLWASLYNNMSLTYQEMGDFKTSKICLEKALSIVVAAGQEYEEAVSRANLAGTCMQLGSLEEGFSNATAAIEIFNKLGVADGHFAAALSALGSYRYIKGEFEEGAKIFDTAMKAMEQSLGKNAFYYRLEENRQACLEVLGGFEEDGTGDEKKVDSTGDVVPEKQGMEICRLYFREYGRKMLEERFPDYVNQIAVGLAGKGSDCFGFDDRYSRDHDWGPGFCMWLTDELYEKIGEELNAEYEKLPLEFMGYKRAKTVFGAGRRGAIRISDFCKALLGCEYHDGDSPQKLYDEIDWSNISDSSLAAFVNGEVWKDELGLITNLREQIKKGFPERMLYLKLAESCGRFSQCGQYNLNRFAGRGDDVTCKIMAADAIREAMKLAYYMEGVYPPHDKWLHKGLEKLNEGDIILNAIDEASKNPEKGMELLGTVLAMNLYKYDFISDVDPYLDHHTEELLKKFLYSIKSHEELAEEIAKTEFMAFDKVQNEGGRASCQNNWGTFKIMRMSQYLTWERPMLLQYLYDFEREFELGHNLITEKYGRMMESTAPDKYEEIKEYFPVISEEKKAIIEAVCKIQVDWMDEFGESFPKLANQARSIHTIEDNAFNTSYETYLRGEISTYSDKMLELYARFVVGLTQKGENLAQMTIANSCKMYGYGSLEEAEAKA